MALQQHAQEVRAGFTVRGQVQGVGFRPFIYRIALERQCVGFVRNTPDGVRIEVQATNQAVEDFARALREEIPPLACIVSCVREDVEPVQYEHEADRAFEILASTAGDGHHVLISQDTATCPDCLNDMFDPENRRYLYPFTNCTNCGPRYTITHSIPYDRDKTSMACFPLCEECAREYGDPLDRRFHAQPNACPACGPQVWLCGNDGAEQGRGEEALRATAKALASGKIAAIKGLGGFHLACLAVGEAGANAVRALRMRKNRHGKPLALMVPDLETAGKLVHTTRAEEELLSGIVRPVVLCRMKQENHEVALFDHVAPDTHHLGIMLPYTPLHHVLLHFLREELAQGLLPALVMTSGNMSSEPIALGNREALKRLPGIADIFLLHNRDILIRTDDSVVRVLPAKGEATQFFRRARGYTPNPVFLADKGPSVFGVGPELKNTLCVTKEDQAFVSQHVGDMENLEAYGFYQELAKHLPKILETEPTALIRDLHPDYLSTRFAVERGEQQGLPVYTLQHHYAHAHAVLAENQHQGPALALALDGTGYGEDGTLWGGECLFVDTQTLEHARLAHFSPVRLPGGEAAIKEPWRIAQSFLWELGITEPEGNAWSWLPEHEAASGFLPQLLKKGLRSPLSSSCGRLFDSVAALLGACACISYEGQAAILLENMQDHCETTGYACPLNVQGTGNDTGMLDTRELFQQVYADWRAGVAPGRISRKFHLGLIKGLTDMAVHYAKNTGVRVVGLSGGVMQNLTLSQELPIALAAKGLIPLTHKKLPPNDACISLGQAAWGRKRVLM